jgi:hypothetical protein
VLAYDLVYELVHKTGPGAARAQTSRGDGTSPTGRLRVAPRAGGWRRLVPASP